MVREEEICGSSVGELTSGSCTNHQTGRIGVADMRALVIRSSLSLAQYRSGIGFRIFLEIVGRGDDPKNIHKLAATVSGGAPQNTDHERKGEVF
ncbi:hypothetical protein FHX08_006388 [Rhizobium sp. BK529]|nr:hypothetical protein [Rhizobium sp. BK529]